MSAKSDTLQLHANIKSTRQLQQSQITKLQLKSDDEVALFEAFKDYSKKRGEIELDYAQRLDKLAKGFAKQKSLHRRASLTKLDRPLSTPTSPLADPENSSGPSLPTSPVSTSNSVRSTAQAFQTLLTETEKQAKSRQAIGEKFSAAIADVIKEFNKDKTTAFKKHSEYAVRFHDDLWKVYAELEKSRKIYEEAEKEAEAAKVKYDDTIRKPKSTLKTITNIVKQRDTQTHNENLRRKWDSAVHRLDNARNEYLLQLDASNSQQTRYYNTDLPSVMKRMDGTYYTTFATLLQKISTQETEYSQILANNMQSLSRAAERIDREQEYETFLIDQKVAFGKPKSFVFDPVGADEVKDLTVDEFSKIALSQKLTGLATRQAEITRELAKKEKDRSGLKQMAEVYKNAPEFGNAGNPHDQIVELDYVSEILRTELARIELQINRITDKGVEVVLPPNTPTLSSGAGAAPTAPGTATAIYDYEPVADGEIAIKEGDVLKIVEAEHEGWIKVEKNGASGLVPANYVTTTTTGGAQPTVDQVKALYDYNAADPTEISFRTGDIIQIVSRGEADDEWWSGTCLRTKQTGQFPLMFVQLPPGVSRPKTVPDGIGSANSSAGALYTGPTVLAAGSANNLNGKSKSGTAVSGIDASHGKSAKEGEKGGNSKKVVALYDYDATCEGELTFRKEDIIDVIDTAVSDDWWEGKNVTTGAIGQFPTAYVRNVPTISPEGDGSAETFVTAQYDYKAQLKGELSFKTGDRIKVISKSAEGDESGAWWTGELQGVSGQFPSTYVE